MLRAKNLRRELFLPYDRSIVLKKFKEIMCIIRYITIRIQYETVRKTIRYDTIGYDTIRYDTCGTEDMLEYDKQKRRR